MRTFYISDHHFGHRNIIKYTGRPFANIAEMNETLIANHNRVVAKDDRVIFGGDFCFGSIAYCTSIFNRLKGKKYLVKGNHDRLNKARAIGFIDVLDYWYENGVLVCHYPRKNVPQKLYDECKIFLYGHIHEKILETPISKSLNMCVEWHDYTPFTL